MRWRARAVAIALSFLAACNSTQERTEGDWIRIADEFEQRLRESGALYRDTSFQQKSELLVCEIEPSRCGTIRVYLVDQDISNAGIAPNGMLLIWRGLLELISSEGEHAYVIAHELGHLELGHLQPRSRDQSLATRGLILHDPAFEAEADAYASERLSAMGYPVEAIRDFRRRLRAALRREL